MSERARGMCKSKEQIGSGDSFKEKKVRGLDAGDTLSSKSSSGGNIHLELQFRRSQLEMPSTKLRLDFKCVTSWQELLFRLSCKFNPQFCTSFPCGSAGKEPAFRKNPEPEGCLPAEPQGKEDPWVGRFPWRREQLPNAVFWPGEFHTLYSSWGLKELDTTE